MIVVAVNQNHAILLFVNSLYKFQTAEAGSDHHNRFSGVHK